MSGASSPGAPVGGGRALVIEGLHKSFGRLEVLRGIDLQVAEHEVVCLIGASGSGKSTLLRCVNLLEPIDAGRIVLAGEPPSASALPSGCPFLPRCFHPGRDARCAAERPELRAVGPGLAACHHAT